MQPNHHAAISTDFSVKNSPTKIPTLGMQLFPTTFLSKTAHAAPPSCSYFHRLFCQKQPNKNPHPRYAAISNDFSIKNSSCSLTIMQLFPPTFLSKTAQQKSPPSVCSYFQRLFYQKQLMQPISNDFSIKNSSSFSPPLFYQKQLMQLFPTLGMQLFPTTFLSKTAHAAQKEKKWKKNHHQTHATNTHTNNHPPNTPPPPHHHHHLPTYLTSPPPPPPTKHPHTHTLHPHIPPPPSHSHAIIHPILTKPFLLYLPCCLICLSTSAYSNFVD
jgi:hypothetical protein